MDTSSTNRARHGPPQTPDVGDVLSDALVMDSEETFASLASFAKDRLLLVFVFRGSWCAFCLRRLVDYRERTAAFRKLGVTLVAVSTDTPDVTHSMKKRLRLPFTLLCDPSRELITSWGLLNVHDFRTAFPATFILDDSMHVRFASIDDSYATARVDDVLDRCKQIIKGDAPTTTLQRVFRVPGLRFWVLGARDEIRLRWKLARERASATG